MDHLLEHRLGGTATITYPDGSKDTIPGDQLVQGQKGDTTDAGNNKGRLA